ncbi:A disintegrin and metalloproteinase with thrombospondin motifs adt-1-like [Mercenaria mercenaria]|uniref:A disintegrin and metalloproteinase with thrombospondin motifs adt-1-like n=1 Tax=Mercenaria mercenaria TaxID=6596 RepID=UPI00234F5C74|nr:A disintegrin and metalloproteinase with thrombospondin motifs adt-1-like [Mercenaria mercenaria]
MLLTVFPILLYYQAFLECHALECFSCQQLNDVNNCNTTIQCNDGESCVLDSYVHTDGTHRFNMGCLVNQRCGASGSPLAPVVGKRQINNCHECCSTDRCNSGMCSHLKPSNCVDDESVDCARLHSLLDVCNDVQHAKLICPKFCGLCNVVDGNWALWSSWASCDVTCENGTRLRTRTCTNPAPAHGGANCIGTGTDKKECHKELCPVHGGWSDWSHWGECSATCDFGMQRRDRSCSNPYPSRFGDNCYGESRDDRFCMPGPCANGGWSDWTGWGSCTATCGPGLRKRHRRCDNPIRSPMGQDCQGSHEDVDMCSLQPCHATISAFSVNHPHNFTTKLTFSHTIYQIGGDFDPSTGTFTCSVPGTYHFSVNLVKDYHASYVYCYMKKNTSNLVYIQVNPDGEGESGESAVSQSTITHLNKGDTVYLGTCTSTSYMGTWSSFTGFLLYPDN